MDSKLLNELMAQAGVNDNPDREGLMIFAELIVREAVSVASWAQDQKEDVGEELLAHFGLEPEEIE